MEIECQNCGHEWDYTGEKEHPKYTNCPACMTKVQIPETDVFGNRAET